MKWKEEIKKQDAKLALESLLREINRDMQALEPIPEKQFTADIMRVKTSSYKEQVERILQMM
ncbi:MAG: hypothetical protein CL605_02425 [Altibacter sp.]|uniref:hypothetical protein n=1 Tax=Altibacter sp. TaxID=2024823 RepID=UPI000C8EA66C|nr:hypothetical protein [Altibacter sp.]MAP53737.1 hypothetical protein [Altibacter sp.]|tara:strand:- start:9 stop:194 length:186 start_codon:yes stop_codon:yes gene_type:complete